MRKLSLSIASVLSSLAISAIAGVRDHRPPPPMGGPGYGGWQPPRMGSCDPQNVAYLRRWVGNDILRLRQLVNLGPQCDGMRVSRVIITGQSDRRYGPGQVMLLVNGRPSSFNQPVGSGYSGDYILQLSPGADVLGREARTLELAVQGMVFIDKIVVTLERCADQPGYPGNPYPGGSYPGGSYPGGYPGGSYPNPGYPQPQPQPRSPVWQMSPQGGYVDTTGMVQGVLRVSQMRAYDGRFVSGQPVPMQQVLVNSVGHICAQPGYPPPDFGNCAGFPTYYE